MNTETVEDAHTTKGDEFAKQLKQLKIQMCKEHEALQLQKQYNQTLQSQIKYVITEKEEALAESKQSSDYAEEMVTKVIDLEIIITQREETIAKYELITHEMMKLSGYELE
tara:strand:- start:1351 stop:1683 length:333 start_codon:yes stop_codon:yes gene_type:complete